MRILLTNDDGYNAPGIRILQSIAKNLAGPDGEVYTVAPLFEVSGTAHCINFVHPFRVHKTSSFEYQIEGNPADCILTGIFHVMPQPPDLILSGINRGNNSGENTLYSGTIGAAMEGALQGIKSIALSQYLGPHLTDEDDIFDASNHYALNLVREIYNSFPWDDNPYKAFFNVNFPACLKQDVKGIRFVHQGYRNNSRFSVSSLISPNKREFLWVSGGNQQSKAGENSDISVNLENYISITPMRADLTDYSLMAECKKRYSKLESLFCEGNT